MYQYKLDYIRLYIYLPQQTLFLCKASAQNINLD